MPHAPSSRPVNARRDEDGEREGYPPHAPAKGAFPLLTLLTNLAGAFVIGVIAGLAAKRNLPQNAVLFLKTGLCGGFTTFSTFSLEA